VNAATLSTLWSLVRNLFEYRRQFDLQLIAEGVQQF
jgi:hypothetical protein